MRKRKKIMKSVITILLLSVLIGGSVSFSAGYSKQITAWFYNMKIIINGNYVHLSKEPLIYDGAIYVPLKDVSDYLGFDVSWDDNTKTASLASKNPYSTLPYYNQNNQNNQNYNFPNYNQPYVIVNKKSIEDIEDIEDELNRDYEDYTEGKEKLEFEYDLSSKHSYIKLEMKGEDFTRTSSDWQKRDDDDFEDFVEDIAEKIAGYLNKDVRIEVEDKNSKEVAEYEYDEGRNKLKTKSEYDEDMDVDDIEDILEDDYDEYTDGDYDLEFDYDLSKHSSYITVEMEGENFDRNSSKWFNRDDSDFREFIEDIAKEVNDVFDDKDVKIMVMDEDNDIAAKYKYDEDDNELDIYEEYKEQSAVDTYTVTFNSQGGSSVSAITGIASGSTITLPTHPSKTDYIFAGWNTVADGSGTAFTASTQVTGNITVYAQWTVAQTAAPELANVTIADDNTSNDRTSITMPALPQGATKFLYVVSSDANPVVTPNVGADWTDYASNTLTASQANLITVENGKNIGIAAVDGSNKVVQFVNKVAVTESNVDKNAPVFDATYPKTANVAKTSLDLLVKMDEAGTAYYKVLANDAQAPTVEEVIADGNTIAVAGTDEVSTTISSGLVANTDYDIYVVAQDDEATPNKQATVTKVEVKTLAADSPITEVTFDATAGLQEGNANVNAGARVGTLGATGGDAPISYALVTGDGTNDEDNAKFAIVGTNLNVGAQALTQGTYKVYVEATDADGDKYQLAITIIVAAEGLITEVTFDATAGLQEGNANVNAGAKVGTLGATGGDAPISYALVTGDGTNDEDNAKFAIAGTNLNVGAQALTQGIYKVYVEATDADGDKHQLAITITVAAAL